QNIGSMFVDVAEHGVLAVSSIHFVEQKRLDRVAQVEVDLSCGGIRACHKGIDEALRGVPNDVTFVSFQFALILADAIKHSSDEFAFFVDLSVRVFIKVVVVNDVVTEVEREVLHIDLRDNTASIVYCVASEVLVSERPYDVAATSETQLAERPDVAWPHVPVALDAKLDDIILRIADLEFGRSNDVLFGGIL